MALIPPRASTRRMAGKPRAPRLCVLLVSRFFFYVGFFLELFNRNNCNKDLVFSWCSDVAGGVGWPLLFSAPSCAGFGPRSP